MKWQFEKKNIYYEVGTYTIPLYSIGIVFLLMRRREYLYGYIHIVEELQVDTRYTKPSLIFSFGPPLKLYDFY